MHVRCFGVLTSIKSGQIFYANLETDQRASWRPQEAEKVPTETFLDDFGPQVEIKRGPRATQNRSKTTKNERYHWQNRVSKRKIYYKSPDILIFLGSMMVMAFLDAKKRFLIDLPTSSKTYIFYHFHKSTKMASQSDWFDSWPLLVHKKVKMDLKMGPKSDIFGPKTVKLQHILNLH